MGNLLKDEKALKLSRKIVARWIPRRKSASHKGDYGHVLIIAGSRGMVGASVLSSLGALRGGAGLVTVAVPKSQQPIVAKQLRSESMTLPLRETSFGTLSSESLPQLLNFIRKRKISSLALGPGLSRKSETVQFVKKLLTLLNKINSTIRGIVLDADGFLALKTGGKESRFLDQLSLPIVVTPHAGELANFCNVTVASIEKNRIEWAKKFARFYQVISVLKGNETVISDGKRVYLNTTGNPGMATAGSGDLLTGLISALIPQLQNADKIVERKRSVKNSTLYPNSVLVRAACVGVFVHGLAGDLAKEEKTEVAMIAGDIADQISNAFKRVTSKR